MPFSSRFLLIALACSASSVQIEQLGSVSVGVDINDQGLIHIVRAEPHEAIASEYALTNDAKLESEIGADGEVTLASKGDPHHELKRPSRRLIRPLPGSLQSFVSNDLPGASMIEDVHTHDTSENHSAMQSTRGPSAAIILLIIMIVVVWASLVILLISLKAHAERENAGRASGENSSRSSGRRSQRDSDTSAEPETRMISTLSGMSMAAIHQDVTEFVSVVGQSISTGDLSRMFGSGAIEHDGETFRDFYEVSDKLGDGSFGVVYAVVERATGKELAVKMIDLAHSDYDDVMMEVEMLRKVRHPTLTVSCMDEFVDSCFYYIVMPKYSGGDLIESLSAYMEENGLLPERIFIRCFEQMTAAVEFVHGRRVVHRDIKPDNFLTSHSDIADPQGRVVLTDFGLAVVLNAGMPQLDDMSGTELFWCPEMMGETCSYSFGCDVWALGLTAHMLLAGRHPFGSMSAMEKWVAGNDPFPSVTASGDTLEMLELALDRNPEERATASILYALVCGHPHFTGEAVETEAKQDVDTGTPKVPAPKLMRIGQAVMDDARVHRRQTMIHALNQEHHKEQQRRQQVVDDRVGVKIRFSGSEHITKYEQAKLKMFQCLPFEVAGENRDLEHFDWWEMDKCAEEGIKSMVQNKTLKRRSFTDVSLTVNTSPEDIAYLTCILADNKVDWLRQWKKPHETIQELARECRKGETVLAEDIEYVQGDRKKGEGGKGERKLIRVVDVVVPVLTDPSGQVLVTIEEKCKDGQFKDPQTKMPGKKRRPWEHRNDTALRALQSVGIAKEHVGFTADREVLIKKEESTTYPGIVTVYRRHVLRMRFKDNGMLEPLLAQKGWPKGEPLVEERDESIDQRRTTWVWISGESFKEQQLLEGDAELAARYAAVVPARTHDKRGNNLREKFKQSVGADAMSDEQWEELAKEEESGECTLIEHDAGDGKKMLKRVVKLTVVRVVHDEGVVLVQVGKEARGKVTPCKRIPAIKQRLHENPFMAARRWLNSRLLVEDDEMHFDASAGGRLEERADSKNFPGLSSVYEKEIIQVSLKRDQLMPIKAKPAKASKGSKSISFGTPGDMDDSSDVAIKLATSDESSV